MDSFNAIYIEKNGEIFDYGYISLDLHFCMNFVKGKFKKQLREKFNKEYSENKNFLNRNYDNFKNYFKDDDRLKVIDSEAGYNFLVKFNFMNQKSESEIQKLLQKFCNLKIIPGSKIGMKYYFQFSKTSRINAL